MLRDFCFFYLLVLLKTGVDSNGSFDVPQKNAVD